MAPAAIGAPYADGLGAFAVVYGVPVMGFALMWLALAAAMAVRAARRGMGFAMTWWAFTFPVGTCVTGAEGAGPAHGSGRLRLAGGGAVRAAGDGLAGGRFRTAGAWPPCSRPAEVTAQRSAAPQRRAEHGGAADQRRPVPGQVAAVDEGGRQAGERLGAVVGREAVGLVGQHDQVGAAAAFSSSTATRG